MLQGVAEWLAEVLEPLAGLVAPVYPWVSAGHILALALLLGSVIILDLRLLGFFRRLSLMDLAPVLVRLAGSGLAAAMVTGLLLFSVQPAHYLENTAFLVKLGLLAVGLANIGWIHRQRSWRRIRAGQGVSTGVRVSALLSVLVWIAMVLAGRWIAFL